VAGNCFTVKKDMALLFFKTDLGGNWHWWILPYWTASGLFFLHLQILMV